MSDSQRPSFWTTIPGILTGIAALVTAITGLIVVLARHADSSVERDEPLAAVAQRQPASNTAAPGAAPADPAPAGPAAKEGTVVITAQDGQVTTVYASSFRHHQVAGVLPLLSGQGIPFDRIRSIEVTRHESDQARVDVTLVNGSVHGGYIASGLSPFGFSGVNDLGRFDIRVDKLSRIDFRR